jgi:adenylate cyclase
MEAPNLERRLAAILAADIEAFSRHMERDEAATLAVLSSHRTIIDALIDQHGGRITGTAGDSVLAEFGSVVAAVRCAVDIQNSLADANAKLDQERRLRFRIGINVGDVMVKDGDIFGDGVNITARLESLADPGGICVSRGVRDLLRNHRMVVFEDLGEQMVKNIAHPVRAFKIRLGETPSESDVPPSSESVSETGASPSGPTGKTEEELAVELAFWESAKDTSDPAELEAYLQRYPQGEFTALATTRLESLRKAAVEIEGEKPRPEEVEVEITFWESVKESNNPTMLKAYLEQFPNGLFAALAKIMLADLE